MIDPRQLMRAVALGTRSALRRGMHVLEPQNGAWQDQNLWGDQRAQPLPLEAGQVVAVLGKNTIMYGPPAVHSLQLARGDETPAVNADVRARITYGCGGTTNSFECDWLHGAQFCLVCNSVSVNAVSYAPRKGAIYDAGDGAVFLAASVVKGSAFAAMPLTFTEERETFSAAEINDYPVRDFVREVTVHVPDNDDPAVAQNVQLQFLDAGGGANAQYDAQVCAGGRKIPLPGSTNILRIRNQTGGVTQATVQWFLGL